MVPDQLLSLPHRDLDSRVCLPGVSAGTTRDEGWEGGDLPPFYCAELGDLPRLSGHIKK